MAFLEERSIDCPYCGESIDILLEPVEADQDDATHYIEDCQVCCRPIQIKITTDFSGETCVNVSHENE
ncbi:CPXCG motif-containing cysteine-rich protein [Pseudomonadales bacterium]|nr:CPXCG motif-containing cysteine-rich protein [Pseudomonadales bacterium]